MLTNFQKQIVLYIKGHYDDYPEIELRSFAAYHFDLRMSQVSEEQDMYVLFPIFDELFPRISRMEMLIGIFKTNRDRGGKGDSIELADVVKYMKGMICTSPKRVYNDELRLDRVDTRLVEDLLAITRRKPLDV